MKTTAGYRVIHSLTEHLQSLQIFLPHMASPFFLVCLENRKNSKQMGPVKSLKIGVWCEKFNVHQVLIYVCILSINKLR